MNVTLLVSGRVQGVGFRYCTKLLADQMGIVGTVKNLESGDVFIEAQGDKLLVQQFIEEVKKSPSPAGKVTQCQITFLEEMKEMVGFKVLN